ncbi:hypothetical protein CEXT_132511 [Caerostris extrusa]|uniref:Uncharacterized protein n=1 Tax=Caerostris extrusa TaxID=172846 RepID=A0AAV4Y9Z8_CAEEX|nr:hypothetical protein CEXT_132511 [Caerostris extrusa]
MMLILVLAVTTTLVSLTILSNASALFRPQISEIHIDTEKKTEGDSRTSLSAIDSGITPFDSPLLSQGRPDLLETSPVGLGRGIMGVGAVDFGHGLGRFVLR